MTPPVATTLSSSLTRTMARITIGVVHYMFPSPETYTSVLWTSDQLPTYTVGLTGPGKQPCSQARRRSSSSENASHRPYRDIFHLILGVIINITYYEAREFNKSQLSLPRSARMRDRPVLETLSLPNTLK